MSGAADIWLPGRMRTLIKVQPDREFSLEKLDVRFTVSYDMPWTDRGRPTPQLIQEATPHIEEAIRIKGKEGWTARLDKGVKFFPSPLQVDSDKLAAGLDKAVDGRDRLYEDGKRDMVAEVWFVRPLDWVLRKELRETPGLKEGFADLPPEYAEAYKRETGRVPEGVIWE